MRGTMPQRAKAGDVALVGGAGPVGLLLSAILVEQGKINLEPSITQRMTVDNDDELGNPWLAIIVGAAGLFLAWYLVARLGASPDLHEKAAIVNSGIGGKLLAAAMAIVGGVFVVHGIAAIRAK